MKNGFLKNFDLLGGSIDFNYDNGVFKTNFGGFVSIIMLILLSLLIFAFGRNFYKRINPDFIRQTEISDIPQMWTINNKNFTIAVRIEDNASITINKPNAFYIEAEYRYFLLDQNNEWYEVINYLKLDNCSENLFNSKENFEYNAYESWICPVFDNISFGGNDTFGSSIKFNFYICNEGLINPFTKEECVSKNELDILKSNLIYMSLAYQTPVINPSNYYNGLTNKVIYDWISLDPKFYKLAFNYFTEYTMTTDYGWILEDKKTESIIIMSKMNTDIIDIDSMPNKNLLGSYWLYVNSGGGIEIFKRNYVKIQTLAAEVGGIMNFFYIFLSIFLINYNNHELMNKLISLYYPNMNEESKSNFVGTKHNNMGKVNEKYLDEVDNNEQEKKSNKEKIYPNQIMEIDISKNNLMHNKYVFIRDDIVNKSNIVIKSKQEIDSINHNNLKLEENKNKYGHSSKNDRISNDNKIKIRKCKSNSTKNVYEQFLSEKHSNTCIKPSLLKFVENNMNNNNLILQSDKLYSAKVNSEEYINTIEDKTLNFVSFLIYMYCCKCSKARVKKSNFLKQIHYLIEKEFDVRNFLRNKAEIANLKRIYNDGSLPFEIQIEKEIKLYENLVSCLE